ncbi:MAG: hypothetical protein ABSG24_07795 [Acidimicrobiales bacterium]|jgi:hypothetical protein
MTTLTHRRNTSRQLNELIITSPLEPVTLTDDHRLSLASRFRAVAGTEHRRLDAWAVEQAGRPSTPFHWSPATARRVLGNASLRRVTHEPTRSITNAVREELDDQLLRAASGRTRAGSLASWLARAPHPVLAVVSAEAVNWTTQVLEVARGLDDPFEVPASDAYYDVATARTTLRGRRELVVTRDNTRIIVRVRSGAPGKSAGPGLRADLIIDALAHHDGLASSRIIGLWPEAGVALSVDGTMADLRAGARDLVRTAVVQRRARLAVAA